LQGARRGLTVLWGLPVTVQCCLCYRGQAGWFVFFDQSGEQRQNGI